MGRLDCKQINLRIFRYLLAVFTGIAIGWHQPLQAQEHITMGNTLQPKGDSALIFGLINQGKTLLDTDSALALFEKAEAISRTQRYADGIGYALAYRGWAESRRGNFEAGFRYYDQALPYCLQARNMPFVLGYLYHHMAASYLYQGDFLNARMYFQRSLSLFESYLPKSPMPIAIYMSLAGIQARLGSFEKAFRYVDYAISRSRETGHKKFLANATLVKGGIYYTLDQPDLAMRYYQEALRLVHELDDPETFQSYYMDMGNALLKKKQYAEATGYFREAIRMNTGKTRPLQGYILPRYSLGATLYGMGKYKEAERILTDALKKAEETGLHQNQTNGHGVLSMVFLHLGEFKKSLEQLHHYLLWNDREHKIEKIRAINEIDTRYQVEKKDRALMQQELEIARQQAKIRTKNLLIGSTGGGILLVTILGVAFYRYKQKIRSREVEIGRLRASLAGEEKERSRLSRELHDGIGGMLTGIKLNLRALQKQEDPITLPEKLEGIMEMLHGMGEELHITAHNLMPEVLQKQSLRQALEVYCSQLQTGGLDLQLQFHNDPDVPDKTRELAIYRIIQELIQNILKHAKASLAVIQIGKNGSLLCISAEDNGIGFDTELQHSGLGLKNIRMRVEALNGYYALSSSPGRGTTAYIEIDLK